MKLRCLLSALAAVTLGGCGDPTSPSRADTPLALSVSHRAPVPSERLPAVQVVGGAGLIQIRVARPALCATIATARVGVTGRELTMVANVSPNPAALCVSVSADVVEYSGTVTLLAPGTYTVRVWESFSVARPDLLETTTVTVAPAGA